MPRATIPDSVLEALAAMPEFWPVVTEAHAWKRDGRTGNFTIRYGNGGLKQLERVETLALGTPVRIEEGKEPYCPVCGLTLELRDHANKVYCRGCDQTRTIWEVKQNDWLRPVGRRAPDGSLAPQLR